MSHTDNWSTEDWQADGAPGEPEYFSVPYRPSKLPKLKVNGTYVQKAIAPMKLTMKVADLTASIQKSIDARLEKYEKAVKEREEQLKTFVKIAKSNEDALAKRFGLEKASQLTEKQIENAAREVAAIFGVSIPSFSPSKPNNFAEEALLATLALVSEEKIEVEEGHEFLSHLGR